MDSQDLSHELVFSLAMSVPIKRDSEDVDSYCVVELPLSGLRLECREPD